jgi:transposase, IS6 family
MFVLASSVCGLFKWRQFEPEVILLAVGWYLRFSLSYRDVEELLAERGVHADHVTVWRWVQRYAPELQRRLRRHLKPTNDSWRMDETYVRVKGQWRYLYRAVDSTGATLDFLLSAKQDAAAAKRFLAKALGGASHPAPRVINTDKHAAYPPAIVELKADGVLEEHCEHRPVQTCNTSYFGAPTPVKNLQGDLTPDTGGAAGRRRMAPIATHPAVDRSRSA